MDLSRVLKGIGFLLVLLLSACTPVAEITPTVRLELKKTALWDFA